MRQPEQNPIHGADENTGTAGRVIIPCNCLAWECFFAWKSGDTTYIVWAKAVFSAQNSNRLSTGKDLLVYSAHGIMISWCMTCYDHAWSHYCFSYLTHLLVVYTFTEPVPSVTRLSLLMDRPPAGLFTRLCIFFPEAVESATPLV